MYFYFLALSHSSRHSCTATSDGRVRRDRKVMEWADLDDQDKFEVEEAEQERLSLVPVFVEKVRHDHQRQQE